MRKFLRYTSTSLTFISLVLAILTSIAWENSHYRWTIVEIVKVDRVILTGQGWPRVIFAGRDLTVGNFAGGLKMSVGTEHGDQYDATGYRFRFDSRDVPFRPKAQRFYFESTYCHEDWYGWRWCPQLDVPHYVLVLMFSMLPGVWLFRRCFRRRPVGFCRCGYDLRQSPDRCPECGTVVVLGRRQ